MINILFPIGENWDWGTFFLYIIISSLVCILCKYGAKYKYDSKMKKSYNILRVNKGAVFYFIAFLILTLLATIRSVEVGSDTEVYVNMFYNYSLAGFSWDKLFGFYQMEPGFQFYLMLVRKITSNYHVFFFFAYAFVAGMYIKYIKYFYDKDSNYIFLMIFIYFYTSNMSGMRAAIATGFLLVSFISLSQKKYIKSSLYTILACMFHYTMMFNFIIVFMTYLMENKNLFKRRWILPVGVCVSFIVCFYMANTMKSILASTKYDFYASVSLTDLSILGNIFFLFYAMLAFMLHKEIVLKYRRKPKLKNIYLLTINFLLTFPAIYVIAAYRIPNYYALPRLTIWSEFTSILEAKYFKRDKLVFRFLVLLLVVFYLLFRYTRAAENGNFMYLIG